MANPGFLGISTFRAYPSLIKLPNQPRDTPFASKPTNPCPSFVFREDWISPRVFSASARGRTSLGFLIPGWTPRWARDALLHLPMPLVLTLAHGIAWLGAPASFQAPAMAPPCWGSAAGRHGPLEARGPSIWRSRAQIRRYPFGGYFC
jgi:hypothetical protein